MSLFTSSRQSLPSLGIARPASLEEIVGDNPKQTEVYMHGGNTLVINFAGDYAQQSQTFGRICTLFYCPGAKRDEFPKQVSTLGATAIGHDFTASELALFYNLARGQNLNKSENQLRELLLKNGIIAESKEGYMPTNKCVISYVQDSSEPEEWRDIFAHELGHAEYFTNPAYRDYCNRFWDEVMTPDDRMGLTEFLRLHDYDIQNTDTKINEAQAYLAHMRYASSRYRGFLPKKRADELRAKFLEGSPVPSFADTIHSLSNGEQ